MKLFDALDAASNDPFEEDGCAILAVGGIDIVSSFVVFVNKWLITKHCCLVKIAANDRWMLTPVTDGFFIDPGWEPLRLKDCHDMRLLGTLKKLS